MRRPLNFGKVRISLLNIVSFVLSIAIMLLVALWLANTIRNRVRRSHILEDSMKIALSKLVRIALLTLAVLMAMMMAGIDITAFAIFGGALGVGLGLGLQRVVSNFVSGFILVFEGSIRPGDVISFGNTFGTVRALHTRHVVIRTRDGMDILVPNENLMTSDITNWSYEGDRRIRLRLPVQIGYNDDPEQVVARLERIALEHGRVLKDPAPAAVLTGFGDNGVNLELLVWIDDPEHGADVAPICSGMSGRISKPRALACPFRSATCISRNFRARQFPLLTPDQVVAQNPRVVESKRRRQTLRTEYRHPRGIVLRPRLAHRLGDIHRRGGVAARIARRIGVTAQQHLERHAQRRFLLGFAHGGMFERFADVHKPPGQSPAVRRVLAPDQHDRHIRTILEFNNDVRGERWRLRCGHILSK